jgi:hypothetical protein
MAKSKGSKVTNNVDNGKVGKLYWSWKCKCGTLHKPFDKDGNRVVCVTCIGCNQNRSLFVINSRTNRTTYDNVQRNKESVDNEREQLRKKYSHQLELARRLVSGT